MRSPSHLSLLNISLLFIDQYDLRNSQCKNYRMHDSVYYLTFTYWTLSSILAILGNGFIILVATNLSKDKWGLRVDKITVAFIFCLSLMDFLYGVTLLIMIVNDIFLLHVDQGVDIFGYRAQINAPIMLINYGMLNMVLNRVNVMSWTANILIILVITIHRLSVIYFPLQRITIYKAKVIGAVCCLVSAVYALYPIAVFNGLSSSSCGDRKAFMIREVCSELEEENLKFGELTTKQQVCCLDIILNSSSICLSPSFILTKF